MTENRGVWRIINAVKGLVQEKMFGIKKRGSRTLSSEEFVGYESFSHLSRGDRIKDSRDIDFKKGIHGSEPVMKSDKVP
jgi:hypothetical protein